MAIFSARIQRHIKASEGGYVNDPKDPGGETNFGISKRAYPNLDIRHLTWAQAVDIYRRDYWEAMKISGLIDQALADNVVDTAINMGKAAAAKLLQQAARVKEDGIIGPATIEAANRDPDTARRFGDLRITRYHKLVENNPNLAKFLKGWIARADQFRHPENIA